MSPVAMLAQADLFLLLAEMLGPPASWTAEREVLPGDATALAEQAGLSDVTPLMDAIAEWNSVDPESAATEHCRLFDGPLTSPPNETIYVRRDKGAVLSDIAGFYRAFQFDLSGEFGEKHDHILAELADYRIIPPHGGWSLLVDVSPLGLDGPSASALLLEKGGIAATAMINWGTAHCANYVRLVYSNESLDRLAGIGERFDRALRT